MSSIKVKSTAVNGGSKVETTITEPPRPTESVETSEVVTVEKSGGRGGAKSVETTTTETFEDSVEVETFKGVSTKK
jgi:hypothetical protein